MKSIPACYLLSLLLPAMVFSTRQGYDDLEKQLKEVFMERSSILRQLSKTSKELDGLKGNLQSMKTNEASSKSDVQKLLEIEEKQREEMKSLQEAFTKQLNEASEKAEKQQATINFLKTEMERKSKMIRDLQNENKSLKNKLLSGNKLCGLRAEESKRIQAQLKELRYGKKDLVSKGYYGTTYIEKAAWAGETIFYMVGRTAVEVITRAQQLTDLEQKLTVAKKEMEIASLDNESQLKALKETVQLCLTSVLHNQPPAVNIISSKPRERSTSSRGTLETSYTESHTIAPVNTTSSPNELTNKEFQQDKNCDSRNVSICHVATNSQP
ncbi:leucine zipper protein 2 isoform X1 [Rana temporaria]|uniref:leucine zipper protein 2 isoform X1 n=1 Tax=Rana temporaria TaxID=8407 RepID=UPI001AAD7790|nr:leucine zipper protein 2 isoform X1 [Rana temporaria]